MPRIVLSLGTLFLIIAPLLSQPVSHGNIQGTLLSQEDQQPLEGATIMLRGTIRGTTSGKIGIFKLSDLPVGDHTLTISMIGYKRKDLLVTVQENKTSELNIELEQSAIQTPTVVITANRREQSLQDVSVSVSVVDDKILAGRNTVTIDQALQYVPGVNITRSQISIRGSTGYSHGVGTRVLILVDGLPFLSGDTEEIIWESIPVADIERIEVVKGSGSALYGSSALGGVINVITKKAKDMPEAKFNMYGGVFSGPGYEKWQWTNLARTFGGINAGYRQRIGDVSYSAGVSRTLDDGFKRNEYWKRWNGWTHFEYDLSPYQSVTLSFSMLDQRRGNFLYWKNIDHALEPKDDQLNQGVHSVRWNLSSSYQQFISNNLYYSVRMSWFRSRWDDNVPSVAYPEGSSSRSDFIIGEFQTNFQISDQHYLTGGISGNYNRVLAEKIFGIHFIGGGAFYIQDEIKVTDKLRTTVGGRYDFQKLGGTSVISQFNPRFGFVYHSFSVASLRGSIGRGFRSPSIAEVYTKTDAGGLTILPNPDLQPERSWSMELGISFTPGETIALDASIFQNDFWDLIEPTFGSDGNVRFMNITRARITGTELTANINLFNKLWTWQISYTHMYPKDILKNDILKYRSRHLFYISTQFSPAPFRFGFDFRYLSMMERIDQEFVLLGIVPDGEHRVPIYVADVHAGIDWNFSGMPVETSFHINNLFQYYYVDMIGNMAPLRNYVLKIGTKF